MRELGIYFRHRCGKKRRGITTDPQPGRRPTTCGEYTERRVLSLPTTRAHQLTNQHVASAESSVVSQGVMAAGHRTRRDHPS
ncbi:hypothetical protein J4Q44_G00226520 [Coregonus suidteri]|uniref:Uncharacterized protein n=1 Tax=Coregonus suidteri TaxID=861788 RepID=A0AAN8QIW2_9TELE